MSGASLERLMSSLRELKAETKRRDELCAKLDALDEQIKAQDRLLNSLLNLSKEGVVSIKKNLEIDKSFSSHLKNFLGTNHYIGNNAIDLLFISSSVDDVMMTKTKLWISSLFGKPVAFFDELKAKLPQEFYKYDNKKVKFFRIRWTCRLDDQQRVQHIELFITDDSEAERYRQQIKEQNKMREYANHYFPQKVYTYLKNYSKLKRIFLRLRTTIVNCNDFAPEDNHKKLISLLKLLEYCDITQVTKKCNEVIAELEKSMKMNHQTSNMKDSMIDGMDQMERELDIYYRALQKKLKNINEDYLLKGGIKVNGLKELTSNITPIRKDL